MSLFLPRPQKSGNWPSVPRPEVLGVGRDWGLGAHGLCCAWSLSRQVGQAEGLGTCAFKEQPRPASRAGGDAPPRLSADPVLDAGVQHHRQQRHPAPDHLHPGEHGRGEAHVRAAVRPAAGAQGAGESTAAPRSRAQGLRRLCGPPSPASSSDPKTSRWPPAPFQMTRQARLVAQGQTAPYLARTPCCPTLWVPQGRRCQGPHVPEALHLSAWVGLAFRRPAPVPLGQSAAGQKGSGSQAPEQL